MHYIKNNLIFFAIFCTIQAFLNASEQQVLQKPIIEAIIRPMSTITYSSSSYEKEVLIPAGFQPTHFSIPYISVEVVFKEDGLYKGCTNQWTEREPEAIRHYEREIECDRNFRAELRKFPTDIPISLLLLHKEGNVLSLTVHGYTTHLICSSLYIENLTNYNKDHALQVFSELNQFNFEELLDFRLTKFFPQCLVYRGTDNMQEAVKRELLIIGGEAWKHGKNSAHTRKAIITRMILQKLFQMPCISAIVLVYLGGKAEIS